MYGWEVRVKPFCVVVDGYSAGNLLAPEFHRRGHDCVHVQTTADIWPILLPTFRPDDFKAKLTFAGDLEKLVRDLAAYPVACVVPGTETGVELADALSERLGVATNGTEKSRARRNKYEMVEAVRSAGLPAARQLCASRTEDLVAWFNKSGLTKVVVKPLNSAGTDRVAVCTTAAEVEAAGKAILGQVNMLGLAGTDALIQEFLDGTEYFLNTVSREGKHHFTEIWRYKKRSINGHDCVYDCNELLPYDDETSKKLREYVLGVLGALEMKNGPAHTEVMMTSKGPVLVELGARLDGLSVPAVNEACVGYGPLDLTADAYLDAEAFARKSATPFPLLKHGLTVYFTSYVTGTVEEIPGEAIVRALPSFFQMRLRVKPGSTIKLTTDYFTAPGFFTLVHQDKNVILNDYELIRRLEQEGKIFSVK